MIRQAGEKKHEENEKNKNKNKNDRVTNSIIKISSNKGENAEG